MTSYVGGPRNVQVPDGLLGARKTVNMGDVYAAALSEAAFEDGPRTFLLHEEKSLLKTKSTSIH